MKLIFLGSPFKGDEKQNILYARACMRDSLSRGEHPFVPHLLYPQVLDDDKKGYTRYLGMLSADAWLKKAECVIMYCDRGISSGMQREITEASKQGIIVEFRYIEK